MYLSRYVIPSFWRMGRKKAKYAIVPRPGMHPKHRCIPLVIILRDVLKIVENAKEAKKVIKSGSVMVDKKVRRDPRFAVGLMDVVEIPKEGVIYRVVPCKDGLCLTKVKEGDKKLCRIENKRMLKGGKVQLNLHDGRNILVRGDKKYKTFDSLLIELPSQEILKHFNFKVGANAFIIGGKNMGERGKIVEIYQRKSMLEKNRVVVETAEKKRIETVKEYVMVGDYGK